MKKGGTLWYGQVVKWRSDYWFRADAKDGEYEAYPRFLVATVREYYPVYQDIVVDFRRLDGAEADYVGYAKAYRRYQFENGGIRMAKDRAKTNPVTDYLLESFVIRISQHCRKQVMKDHTMRIKRQNEQPLLVHMPFLITGDFMQQLHDAGVDKATTTMHAVPGLVILHSKDLVNWEFASYCFDRFDFQDDAFALKNHKEIYGQGIWAPCIRYANGQFPDGGFWPGGLAYNLCTKKALDLGWCQMDIARLRDVIGEGPLFFDVISANQPRRCGHPAHKVTADGMCDVYTRLYELAVKKMGGAASECGLDIGIRYLDYVNYLWHEIGFLKSNKFRGFQSGVFPVWELVYHGVVFYTSDRWLQNHTYGNEDRSNGAFDFGWGVYDYKEDPEKALKHIEFGSRPIFYTHTFTDIPAIAKGFNEYKPVRHLQKEEMVSHRELAPEVFETTYGDGSRTVVNYRRAAFGADSISIPALGYVLVGPDGAVKSFAFDSDRGLAEVAGK